MNKYGEGIYRIVHSVSGWCVAKIIGHYDDGRPRFLAVSNYYVYRGWAQAFARRRKLNVENYESSF